MRVFEVFTDRFLNITKPHRGRQQLNREDEKRRESIFEVAIAFEEFALNYGKHHLSGTKRSTKITSQKMGELNTRSLFRVFDNFIIFRCLTNWPTQWSICRLA